MHLYKLTCDDAEAIIHGEQPIPNLKAAVKEALAGMTYSQVVEPCDDWFEAIVDGVCEKYGHRRLAFRPQTEQYVEDLYFAEVRKREKEEPGEGDDCPECGDIMASHEAGDLKTVMCQGCGYSPGLGDDDKPDA